MIPATATKTQIRKPRPVLVIDPDPKFLEELKTDPVHQTQPLRTAATGKEAQLLLSEPGMSFCGVFVNLSVSTGLSVVRFAHLRQPSVPIYVIYEGTPPLTNAELVNLPIQKCLPKPLTFSQLTALVVPKALFFDSGAALKEGESRRDEQVGGEVTGMDAEFLPIRAEDFLSGSKSFFDVYVRLVSGRYVKILQAGDAFSPDRLQTYLAKGVTHFYLRKEAQERYLSYCDTLTTALLSKKGAPMEMKIGQTLNHGEETMSFLRNQGLSDVHLQYAGQFIENVSMLSKQLEPGKHELFKGFLADVAAYDHGVSTAMLSSLLCHPLKIESDKAVKVVGLAALLHDIGLQRLPEELRDEDESKMAAEQVALYRTHPGLSAQILKEIRGVDPATLQAVSQHHERRNKKGFPSRTGASRVNRVAEIVGICDEFARLVKQSIADPKINALQKMETDVFDGFSRAVVDAFKEVFLVSVYLKDRTTVGAAAKK